MVLAEYCNTKEMIKELYEQLADINSKISDSALVSSVRISDMPSARKSYDNTERLAELIDEQTLIKQRIETCNKIANIAQINITAFIKCLDKEQDKLICALRWIDGLMPSEISEKTNISYWKVKNILKRLTRYSVKC